MCTVFAILEMFLAVKDSSIGDIVTHSLSESLLILESSEHYDYNDYSDYNDYNNYNDYTDSDLDR